MVDLKNIAETDNPLDLFEDLLEVSSYDYQREGRARLSFSCLGKGGDYYITLEWNEEVKAMRCSLILTTTKNLDTEKLNLQIALLNEGLWDGYFMIDGVGNSVFKTMKDVSSTAPNHMLCDIEEMIDRAVEEMDRLAIILNINPSSNTDLFDSDFKDEDETLSLLLRDPAGNA